MCAWTARSPKTEVAPASLSGKPRPACPYPSLYQVNTRVLLTTLSRRLGWAATLDDISDADLDQIAANGFDWAWFLGVWQTGAVGRSISLSNPEWRHEFQNLLPDFSDADVNGSCFAITSYSVHTDFGGNAALDRLRGRIHDRGMRLLLDFVPNHMAPDHPWARQYPDYFVHGTASQLEQEPQNYTRSGSEVLAYGRDPYFPGWPDTLQLNYANPALQEAMARELENIAALCDGVRCDMAMLILPDVFQRTWGMRPADFWPTAIARARARNSGFVFMAEVYWDLEWTLQQQGFDYTYDKRLYDRLREAHARPVRDHFRADMGFQRSSARFLENHDEPRAASDFPAAIHRAAAILTFLCPGLRFIHQGQMDGFTRRIPVHLNRGPAEPVDSELRDFYARLLRCIHHPTAQGQWQLLECAAAWDGNWTVDGFICFAWRRPNCQPLLVAVNYAPNPAQCYLHLPLEELRGKSLLLRDLMGPNWYERQGNDLLSQGLYLDLPPWGYNVFELFAAESKS